MGRVSIESPLSVMIMNPILGPQILMAPINNQVSPSVTANLLVCLTTLFISTFVIDMHEALHNSYDSSFSLSMSMTLLFILTAEIIFNKKCFMSILRAVLDCADLPGSNLLLTL